MFLQSVTQVAYPPTQVFRGVVFPPSLCVRGGGWGGRKYNSPKQSYFLPPFV